MISVMIAVTVAEAKKLMILAIVVAAVPVGHYVVIFVLMIVVAVDFAVAEAKEVIAVG